MDKDSALAVPCILTEASRRQMRAHARRLQSRAPGHQKQTGKEPVIRMWISSSERGMWDNFHHGSVHKPIPIQEPMRIPEDKVAVNKE